MLPESSSPKQKPRIKDTVLQFIRRARPQVPLEVGGEPGADCRLLKRSSAQTVVCTNCRPLKLSSAHCCLLKKSAILIAIGTKIMTSVYRWFKPLSMEISS